MRRIIEKVTNGSKSKVLLDQAIFSGCGFLITLLIVRILTPINFGVYSSIVLVNYFVLSISNALVIQPFQVYMAQVKQRPEYISFVFYLQLAFVLLLICILVLIAQLEFKFLEGFEVNPIHVILFMVSFLAHDFFRKVFLAIDSMAKAILIDFVTFGLQLIFVFYIYFLGPAVELSELVLLLGLAYVPSVLISIYLLDLSFGVTNNWASYVRVHQKEGKWLLMTAVLQWGSGNFFVISSGLFLGAAALGALRLIQSVFGVLNLVLQTFENYTLPYASRLFQDSKDVSKSFLRKMSIRGAVSVGALLILVFIFSKFIIVLIGGEAYAEYDFLVKGMALLYFIIFLGYPTRIAIRMMALNQLFFVGYVLSFLFSLLSFQYLLSTWNLWGAVIGLIINQIILFSVWQYFLIKNQFNLWK